MAEPQDIFIYLSENEIRLSTMTTTLRYLLVFSFVAK